MPIPAGGDSRSVGNWALLLLVASGVALSVFAWHLLREREEAATRTAFLRSAERQQLSVAGNLRQHLDSMRGLESLFRFSSQVDREEFRGYAGALLQRYPGVQAFQWAPRVSADQRAAIEETAREEGIPNYQIQDRLPSGEFAPAAPRPVYFPIFYTEPRAGNELVFGYDIAQGPNRAVLEKARDSGMITGTAPITLAQEREGGLGWVLVCPVFKDGADTHSVEGRRAHLIGFLQGVFRMPDMFAAAWQTLQHRGIETMVLDLSPGAPRRQLYDAGAASHPGRPQVSEEEMRSGLHVEHPLEIAGRQWSLLMRPDPLWLQQYRSHYPEAFFIGGLIITGLLGAYVHLVRTRTRAVARLVARRTAELAASRDSLQLALHDLKKAEETSHRLATGMEQSTEIVLILAPTGEVQYVNQAFYRTGLASEDVLGAHVDRLPQPVLGEHPFAAVVEQIGQEGSWAARVHVPGGDARPLSIDLSISPVRAEAGAVVNYVLVGRDVSREVVLEEQLRTSQKMEAVGLLAGGIAHDFNNLLQVIEGYTALCLDLPCSPEELPLHLQQVREAASRAAQLTKQLLLFSRRQPLARTEVDLRGLSASMLKMISRLIGPQIKVVFEAPSQIWAVQADRSQLEQVLLNLCVNARDAMPEGGCLRIELREVELTAMKAREFADLAAGRYVLLRVEDSGSGMTPEMQERIFEPFFTTKPNGRGTGLGLSVVYGIVKQHEGTICVTSALGQGTTFDVYLPALGAAATAAPESEARPLARGNETVLLVEDEAPVRKLTAFVLRQAGYHVLQAVDGQEACEVFADRKDEIDFILMDVIMPRMGGVEAAKRIGEIRQVPILFCSGYTGGTQDLPRGAPLLPKPFTSEKLLAEIRAFLTEESRRNGMPRNERDMF